MHAHTHTPKEVTQKEKRKESMHINKKKNQEDTNEHNKSAKTDKRTINTRK